MKSYNHLYEKVYEKGNLTKALHRSARGKNRRRVGEIVKWCLEHESEVITELQNKLKTETYSFRHHKPHKINDGISHKVRYIVKPDYKEEQILHHAVVQVLSPIIMKSMDRYCCGSVPMRGGSYGKKYLEKFIRSNPKDCKYCLKLDIEHFFPSVNHRILKKLILERIHDERMCRLLFAIIDNYEDAESRGIPIGYYTSQWFANWYLEKLDHYIKEQLRVKCMVRYMDDIVILGSNKRELHRAKQNIEDFLTKELDLKLNKKWQVFRFDYSYTDRKGHKHTGGRFLDFMGYRFYRNRTTMRKSILYKATRKARRLKQPTWYSASQMISYVGRFKETDTYGVFQTWIKPYVRIRNLRKIVSRHQRRLNNENRMVQIREYSKAA